jgi:hypothetical protein
MQNFVRVSQPVREPHALQCTMYSLLLCDEFNTGRLVRTAHIDTAITERRR